MPDYRLSFLFEYGKSGWSEQWFRTSNTLEAAVNIQTATLNNYMRIRADGVTLRAIRANDVDVKRRSLFRIVNLTKSTAAAGSWAGGEPPSTAVLCYVTGANFTRRPLLLKGLSDDEVSLTGTGNPIFTAAFLSNLTAFKSALNGFGASIRALQPSGGINLDRVITQLSPANADLRQTAITFTGADVVAGQRVVFHGLPRNQYPGFSGSVPVTTVGPGAITVPVSWTGSTTQRPGLGATFRVANYSLNLVEDVQAEDFRSKKVGRPSLLQRGRRSGLRFRSA